MNTDTNCARCGEGTMKTWPELTGEEREVVKRLPGAADYRADERETTHQWCTRCWNEETARSQQV
jgi:hypothetical protein